MRMSQETAAENTHVDEVLHEWNVFVGTEMTPFLHLCPMQSASLAARFNSFSGSTAGRFKPSSRRLELQLPFSSSEREFLDGERAAQLQMSAGMKISGSGWPWRPVQYMVGQFVGGNERNDKGPMRKYSTFNAFVVDDLFLNPVESIIPLATSLASVDEFEARQRAASSLPSLGSSRQRSDDSLPHSASAAATAAATGATTKTIHMQFRKKETEEQVQARMNSYAYLQRQVDDEPWMQLKHFSGQVRTIPRTFLLRAA